MEAPSAEGPVQIEPRSAPFQTQTLPHQSLVGGMKEGVASPWPLSLLHMLSPLLAYLPSSIQFLPSLRQASHGKSSQMSDSQTPRVLPSEASGCSVSQHGFRLCHHECRCKHELVSFSHQTHRYLLGANWSQVPWVCRGDGNMYALSPYRCSSCALGSHVSSQAGTLPRLAGEETEAQRGGGSYSGSQGHSVNQWL